MKVVLILMVFVMTFVVTFVGASVNFGFHAGFIAKWVKLWGLSFLVALPVVMITMPSIKKKLAKYIID